MNDTIAFALFLKKLFGLFDLIIVVFGVSALRVMEAYWDKDERKLLETIFSGHGLVKELFDEDDDAIERRIARALPSTEAMFEDVSDNAIIY